MTHEVGHFLGLRHIWGDDDDVCQTDYCEDTPPAHKANYNCDTSIENCTPDLFEMVQNYMDYTNDSCMNIFTNNQKTRMLKPRFYQPMKPLKKIILTYIQIR